LRKCSGFLEEKHIKNKGVLNAMEYGTIKGFLLGIAAGAVIPAALACSYFIECSAEKGKKQQIAQMLAQEVGYREHLQAVMYIESLHDYGALRDLRERFSSNWDEQLKLKKATLEIVSCMSNQQPLSVDASEYSALINKIDEESFRIGIGLIEAENKTLERCAELKEAYGK
jgi:hypothetical protein